MQDLSGDLAQGQALRRPALEEELQGKGEDPEGREGGLPFRDAEKRAQGPFRHPEEGMEEARRRRKGELEVTLQELKSPR